MDAHGSLDAAHLLQVDLAPGVVMMTLFLLQFFRSIPGYRLGGSWQARLAGSIFGIYLIHPLVMEAIWRMGLDFGRWGAALGIPATTAMVFMLSWVLTMRMQALPGLRRLV